MNEITLRVSDDALRELKRAVEILYLSGIGMVVPRQALKQIVDGLKAGKDVELKLKGESDGGGD